MHGPPTAARVTSVRRAVSLPYPPGARLAWAAAIGWALVLAWALLGAPPALAVAAGPGAPMRPDWASYVESPRTREVEPARIVRVAGDVSDAAALVHPRSGGLATLRYLPGGPAPVIVLDYGREVGGYPRLAIAGSSGAPTLRSAYSETLANLSLTGDLAYPGVGRYDDYRIGADGLLISRQIQGGERYQLLTLTTPGTVSLRSVGIRFTGVLAGPQALRGYFLSSSNLLNRIWYAGVYTLSLTELPPGTPGEPLGEVSDLPMVLDGAKRDRVLWTGDLAIADETAYYTLGSSYVKGSLQLIGDAAIALAALLGDRGVSTQAEPLGGACEPIANGLCLPYSASYSMLCVVELYDYYLYTGDKAFVRREWPLVRGQMAWDARQVDANGLFEIRGLDGGDWNGVDHPGELTYVNAVYVLALADAARLAQALGHGSQVNAYLAAATAIRRAVNARLWDSRARVYAPSTSERGAIVQDANVFAILSRIAGPRRARALTGLLTRSLASRFGALNVSSPAPPGYGQVVSPYMAAFQLQTDFQTGRPDAAFALLRTEWGWMVTHDPGGTDWEKIESDGVPSALDSTAHAWSTGATAALSQYVLGVAPLAAGFARLAVQPHPGTLRWAEGRVPTPNGPVEVSWRRQRCGGFAMQVRVPSRTTAALALPRAYATTAVLLDGRLTSGGSRAGAGNGRSADAVADYVYLTPVGPGEHFVRTEVQCRSGTMSRT